MHSTGFLLLSFLNLRFSLGRSFIYLSFIFGLQSSALKVFFTLTEKSGGNVSVPVMSLVLVIVSGMI